MTRDAKDLPHHPTTAELLEDWHAGDTGALAALLERHRAWLLALAERRRGSLLRRCAEPADLVQDVATALLRYRPPVPPHNGRQLRALLRRALERAICTRVAAARRRRRCRDRERPLAGDSALRPDPSARSATRPSEAAQRSEGTDRVRLALGQLPPELREVLLLRTWESHTFAAIGTRLALSEAGVRARYGRALRELSARMLASPAPPQP